VFKLKLAQMVKMSNPDFCTNKIYSEYWITFLSWTYHKSTFALIAHCCALRGTSKTIA